MVYYTYLRCYYYGIQPCNIILGLAGSCIRPVPASDGKNVTAIKGLTSASIQDGEARVQGHRRAFPRSMLLSEQSEYRVSIIRMTFPLCLRFHFLDLIRLPSLDAGLLLNNLNLI